MKTDAILYDPKKFAISIATSGQFMPKRISTNDFKTHIFKVKIQAKCATPLRGHQAAGQVYFIPTPGTDSLAPCGETPLRALHRTCIFKEIPPLLVVGRRIREQQKRLRNAHAKSTQGVKQLASNNFMQEPWCQCERHLPASGIAACSIILPDPGGDPVGDTMRTRPKPHTHPLS